MTSNTQGDTPPIQPDNLDDILYEHLDGTLEPHHIADIASSVWQWHQQALERERLEAQTAAAVAIREKLANATTNTPAWAGGVEIVNDYIEENEARLSTLTNKDKDNV